MIEVVVRLLSADHKEAANVVTSKGKHLGRLSMSEIIGATVPPNPQANSAPAD